MARTADRFDLNLSLNEVVVLFFVMVALFTGLLFFGYRVGYMHSSGTSDLSSQPVAPAAPAQESPGVEENSEERQADPEIRLENSPPGAPGDDPLSTPVESGEPSRETIRPLAVAFGECNHATVLAG